MPHVAGAGWLLNLVVLVAGAAMPVPPDLSGPQKNGGLAFSYALPTGDFADTADNGIGVSAIFDYPLSDLLDMSAAVGWYRFGADAGADQVSLWEFSAGPQLRAGPLYGGVEAGYYTNVKEWGLVPNVGLRHKVLDLGLRYKATGAARFFAVRIGFFF